MSDREDAERHVDAEQPAPVCHRQHRRGDGRAERGGGCDDEGVDADSAPEVALRIGEAHQRGVHAHDAGGTQALDDARDAQGEERGRQSAGERGEGEHRESGLRDAPVADDLAERGERQQHHQDRELVGVDDPDGRGGARAEVARDGGQGDVDDGAVEHRHADREQDRGDRPVAARYGQAVGRCAGDRRAPVLGLGICPSYRGVARCVISRRRARGGHNAAAHAL